MPVLQIVFHAIKALHTDLLVGHLTTAETQRDFARRLLSRKRIRLVEFLPDSRLFICPADEI